MVLFAALTGQNIPSRVWHLTASKDEHFCVTVSSHVGRGLSRNERLGVSVILKFNGTLDSVCVHKGRFGSQVGIGTRMILPNDTGRWPMAERLADELLAAAWFEEKAVSAHSD